MQEDYYSDFEIITLNPNVEYQTSDDEECDYEGENGSDFEGMEYEDIVACQEGIKNVNNIIKYDNGDKSSQTPTTVVISELIKNVDHFESEMNIESNEVVMEDCVDVANAENVVVVVNNEEEKPMQFDNDKNVTTTVEITKPRKKLNLAEYKIHRAKKPLPTIAENKSVVLELCEMPESLPTLVLPTDPRSIKNLMTNQQQQTNDITDDNETVAMTVVEEVAPQNENFNNDENEVITQTIHPDYEEITYVDIGCNTDISIAPNEDDSETTSSSTNFLTNIVNSFQQNDNPKAIFNSSTSLLSSINAVVLSEKIHNSANDVNTNNSKNSNKGEIYEHGENKVIMHLRKDRLRPFRSSNGIQTEITPLFPPLILSPSLIFNRIKNARNFRRKSSRSRSRSRSISPEPEYYNRRNSYKYSRSVNSSSMNSSDSSDSDTSAYSSCRSSDSLKRFDNRYKRSYQRPNFNYQGKFFLHICLFLAHFSVGKGAILTTVFVRL